MPSSLERDLDLALQLADAADDVSMAHFTAGRIEARAKPDGTPVTDADLAVEKRLAGMVAEGRPGDGFLGEEVGLIPATGRAARRWIVDGIDGTVLFVAGDPAWGTQIALEVEGRVVVGVTTSPATGFRWWASAGGGAWRAATGPGARSAGGGGPARLRVSPVGTTGPEACRATVVPAREVLAGRHRAMAERLDGAARHVDHDCAHGALLVAEGSIEACLQPMGGPWDFAALTLVVEEAGGRYGDLEGRRDIHGGGPILYSNGLVHEPLVKALSVPA